MKSGKVYFPNLNAIRFIAAFMVVIHHIEQFKLKYELPNNFDYFGTIYVMGKLGVILFFVLSGFLITYLLLKEEQVTTKINIRDFYIRRILKIWPLYFLIFIVGLYLLPNIPGVSVPGYGQGEVQGQLWFKTFLFVFFLPNLMVFATSGGDGFIPGINQLWSIGAEEQFYLFWPWLFKKIKVNRFIALFAVIAVYLAARIILSRLPEFESKKAIDTFLYMFNIDCMAVGGLTAMIYFYKKTAILNFLYNKYLQWIVLVTTVIMIVNGVYFNQGYYAEMYSILFAICILNFATNPKPIFSLESKWANYLGKISYGIYMYHCISIMIVISVLKYFSIAGNISIYLGTIALTLGLSSLSYHFFEERFIKMKVRFSKVVSGDNAKDAHDTENVSSVIVSATPVTGVKVT